MKREYVRPMMVAERFVANEYVAACGTSGTDYKFVCDAGDGVSGNVWLETNGVAGLQTEAKYGTVIIGGYDTGIPDLTNKIYDADDYLSSYHACNIEHTAATSSVFLDGYYVVGDSVTKVIVWRGANNNNTHCTENLDISSWETTRS